MSAQAETLQPEAALAPVFEALKNNSEDPAAVALVARAKQIRVNSQPTAQAASDLLGVAVQAKKALMQKWAPIKQSAHALHKQITTACNENIAPYEAVELICKKGLSEFALEQRRREQAQISKENERRAEQQHKLEEEQRKALVSAGESEEIAAEIAKAETPVIATPPPAPTRPAVQGVTTRMVKKATVTSPLELMKAIVANPTAFPVELMSPNMTRINQLVKAHAGTLDIPGVTVTEEAQVSTRSRSGY